MAWRGVVLARAAALSRGQHRSSVFLHDGPRRVNFGLCNNESHWRGVTSLASGSIFVRATRAHRAPQSNPHDGVHVRRRRSSPRARATRATANS